MALVAQYALVGSLTLALAISLDRLADPLRVRAAARRARRQQD